MHWSTYSQEDIEVISMTQITEPYYDTDPANKAYVDKVNGKTAEVIGTKSRNFGMAPEPPYHVNDTYMDGSNIYICIRDKEFGTFDKADWKLATDYTNDDVAKSKNKVFTEQPVPPYIKGDLWTSGPNGELRRCVNSRETGSYVDSDWENATSYDNTHTVIENGLVTAGTIQVVNGGTVAAGMTGNEAGDNAVRFWAGATSANKNTAPFRVTQKGYLYAYGASITNGTISIDSNENETARVRVFSGDYSSDFFYNNIKMRRQSEGLYRVINLGFARMNDSHGEGPNLEMYTTVSGETTNHTSISDGLILVRGPNSEPEYAMITPRWIMTPKIDAGNIDSGRCGLRGDRDTVVSFNKTFSSPPIVVLTFIENGTPNNIVYSGSVIDTTTTNFTAFYMTNSSSLSTTLAFNWIAIGT